MISAFPHDQSQIARAAEVVIADHGGEARTKADEWARSLRSEGLDSVAKPWAMICEAIGNFQAAKFHAGVGSKIMIDDKLPEGYVILCNAKVEDHTFLVRRLGPSVECPKCGSTALSTDLAHEFWLRRIDESKTNNIPP